ncbi:hypothetical protein [Alkalimarinus alittae]|uniref:Uncharacterized protein n=1 Tax=Alkalimarinus alittae TaxID=2961619 RepID=A0ABY6MYR7_9ALTE|nr:hypothetical protein [Alkalimarinus alittae]UZE94983.1 hypothetical protein NKI27_13015 [Alkalimarinus alittae]
MDKQDQDMDDTLFMEDIPILNDIVTESRNNNTTNSPLNRSQPQPTLKESTKSERKENPFLPYEHLAKLAQEREQFTQSLEAFTENLKHERTTRDQTPNTYNNRVSSTYNNRVSSTYNNRTPNKNDAIVQAITNKVLNQLKPMIEEQIATELSLYFDDIVDND